jgi:SpoVK/Ycf46/Vps4 family AAA+-type ATPase
MKLDSLDCRDTMSELSNNSSYNNLEGYVKGGGKIAMLVSRDLTRVTGSCIKLAKKSGRTLYRWDGQYLEKKYIDDDNSPNITIGSENTGIQSPSWESLGEYQDFKKVFTAFISIKDEETSGRGLSVPSDDEEEQNTTPEIEFDSNSILWMPLRQPFLVQDGGDGRREGELLRQNMDLCRWALKDDGRLESDSGGWSGKTVIIGGLAGKLPPELKSVTHLIRWEYPSRSELRELIFGQRGEYEKGVFNPSGYLGNGCGSILDKLGKQSQFAQGVLERLALGEYKNKSENFIQKMVVAAQGLDIEDCNVAVLSSFREAIEKKEPLMNQNVIDRVMARKVELLSSDGLLTVEDLTNKEDIGGYQNIVNEIELMRARFKSPEGERFGIKKPKGVMLTGVPGCGKSLTAKTIASILECPLLGFDLGKITTAMYGETEENMHRALNMATGMAPCVLWIDEFEKMFSSARSGGQGGHEVSERINAIFLKWMEERTDGVFVVATSNDLSGIKAEYQRTGRWNGTYFFDLPSKFERKAIIENVLQPASKSDDFQISLSQDEISTVIDLTVGWAGSDIVALLGESKNIRFNLWLESDSTKRTNNPVLLFSDVETAWRSGKITPMQKKDKERLNKIRLEGRAYTSASKPYADGDEPIDEPVEPPNRDQQMSTFFEAYLKD